VAEWGGMQNQGDEQNMLWMARDDQVDQNFDRSPTSPFFRSLCHSFPHTLHGVESPHLLTAGTVSVASLSTIHQFLLTFSSSISFGMSSIFSSELVHTYGLLPLALVLSYP
jgi:hypothetical protein